MDAIRGDALRGHLETMALAALESGAAHGFEVWRRLEEAARQTHESSTTASTSTEKFSGRR